MPNKTILSNLTLTR